MQNNNFAILVSMNDGIPIASHLPLTIIHDKQNIRLCGHFAKANPQWKTLTDQELLVIFAGPHAYISPTHYDKHESVPTWNYVTVHAYGTPEIILHKENPEKLESLLVDLIETHEASYKQQWDNLPSDYKNGMKQGIVGIEIEVSRLEGKAKLSQNKSGDEQARIAHGLQQSDATHELEVAYAMKDQSH